MFEKYTEKARRVIFFARYEASQLGSSTIDSEHILLGLIREDKKLSRFFPKGEPAFESLRKAVESQSRLREKISTSIEIPLSSDAKRVLNNASEEAELLGNKFVGTEHILLGLLREKQTTAGRLLYEQGLRLSIVRDAIGSSQTAEEPSKPSRKKKDPLVVYEFSRDLTECAFRGELDPLIGRDNELDRVIQILCRRTKNNPVLIGEPGVGKTAIVEGLAQRIVDGKVPPFLTNKRIIALDLSLVVAGTKYRGQFEERLKSIMKELIENKDFIVFIDELHTLVGAGSAEGSLDAANILKPSLSRGELQCIGSTTPADFRKFIEKDRSLERRFQAIKVDAPNEDETIRILRGIRERYENFHNLKYTDDALESSVYLSNRYISDRFLPDKAIDLMDEAGARVKLRYAEIPEDLLRIQKQLGEIKQVIETTVRRRDYEEAARLKEEQLALQKEAEDFRTRWHIDLDHPAVVTRGDIEEVVARWTGVPVAQIKEEEMNKLLRMEEELHRYIISQDDAISALARAIRRGRAGLKSPNRPVGSFLFLGPTGVGKTEVAKRLTEFLFGSEQALIRFDMSEYMEKHSVAKLIGSPPGYVGHEEGGQLTEKVKRNPYSVILLDEIEKAHFEVYNILLQVFEEGHLTDSLGNRIDFKNTIVIMTSNIGAKYLERRGSVGFRVDEKTEEKKSHDMIKSEVKKIFRPEFLNRIDETIIFKSLDTDDLRRIVHLLIAEINRNLARRKITIEIAPEVADFIIDKTCSDRSYGARPLRRAIQKYIEDPVSEILIQGKIQEGAQVVAYVEMGEIAYRLSGEKNRQGQPLLVSRSQ
ncbi:MAG TPA: ATP-dependent Clp protease ATP-binding subunit [Acidobacteriota bacterium]|nr:ATP-dependent Clp protease ATP-binding subunit [Acidobacteriota bacterium]HQM63929.1 ATP-dependent Clp protease ATP-binding subunit [Acidobacteriota bacterium]